MVSSFSRLLLQLENSFRKDKRNNVALQWNLHILGLEARGGKWKNEGATSGQGPVAGRTLA